MLDIEIVPKAAKGRKGRRRQGYIQLRTPAVDENKVMVGETDMPVAMQSHAVRAASEALDLHQGTDYKDVAYYIKSQFDKEYGTGWQCITGVSFGSYVTHSSEGFQTYKVEDKEVEDEEVEGKVEVKVQVEEEDNIQGEEVEDKDVGDWLKKVFVHRLFQEFFHGDASNGSKEDNDAIQDISLEDIFVKDNGV